MQNIVVVDDFYQDPDLVRESALRRSFEPPSGQIGFNGYRLRPTTREARSALRRIASHTRWKVNGDITMQGHYKALTARQDKAKSTRVHTDPCEWSGVVCLMPPELLGGYTSFWRHKRFDLDGFCDTSAVQRACLANGLDVSGLVALCNRDSGTLTKWIETTRIAYKYNRLILFRGALFHAAGRGFGTRIDNAKLIQTFFFFVED